MVDDERLRCEARRVYLRYAVEVVERLNLCPFARRARLDGRIRPLVVVARSPAPEDMLPFIDEIAAQPDVDIGLLIAPRLELDAPGFHRFVARVRDCEARRHAGTEPAFHMADFHPVAGPDMSSPARLVSFIRRTPDPTIQLVRRAALDSVRKTANEGTAGDAGAILAALAGDRAPGAPSEQPPLHQRIAAANHAIIAELGIERLTAVLDDIRRDRDRAYGRAAAAPLPAQ